MRERARDCALLLIVSALLTLPNLGYPSLWDMDEGVNAQTAREMRDAETWVIPTFNFQLRTAKPVMLYWLQRISYAAFGLSEWSARLPSVLAGWFSVLCIYELARRMFGRSTGLLAGVILASVAQFAMLVHAATPDATLLAFTILAFLLFWVGHVDGSRQWWTWMAVGSGLAFLTKGPVGLILPAIVVVLYFAWNRELRRLLDYRLFLSSFIFVLVAGPWYGIVASETRGEWLKTFFTRENVDRFLSPMDRHDGSLVYYFVVIPIMYAPWSAFLIPLFWYGVRGARRLAVTVNRVGRSDAAGPHPDAKLTEEPPLRGELTTAIRANRFLLCWIGTYLLFFTAAATKLPNYMLPIYPAMAILTARFLVTWRDGQLTVPDWMLKAIVGGMILVGLVTAAAIGLANQFFPGLAMWAVLALIPLAGAVKMAMNVRQGNRSGFVMAVSVTAVLFIGLVVIFPARAIEARKAPKELVRMSGVDNPNRDIRLGNFEWMLPSVIFYSGREVKALPSPEKAAEFLAVPTPGYLFVTEKRWNDLVEGKMRVPYRIVAKHYDFLEKGDVLVVTNDLSGEVASRVK